MSSWYLPDKTERCEMPKPVTCHSSNGTKSPSRCVFAGRSVQAHYESAASRSSSISSTDAAQVISAPRVLMMLKIFHVAGVTSMDATVGTVRPIESSVCQGH